MEEDTFDEVDYSIDPDCQKNYDPDLPIDDQTLDARRKYPFAISIDKGNPTQTRIRTTLKTSSEMINSMESRYTTV